MLGNKKLLKKIEELNSMLQKANLDEIGYILGNRKEIFLRNILAGLARGVGVGIGVTVITAILVIIAQRIIKLNIPIIGEYVMDIVEIVEQKKY